MWRNGYVCHEKSTTRLTAHGARLNTTKLVIIFLFSKRMRHSHKKFFYIMNFFESLLNAVEIGTEQVPKTYQELISPTFTDTTENDRATHSNVPTDFPLYGLPERMQIVCNAVYKGFDTHKDYVVAAMFAAASAAIGKNCSLCANNHLNYCSNWITLIGEPGMGKSQPLQWFMRPLLEKDKELHKNYEFRRKEWENNGAKGEKPKEQQRITDDFTPEKLFQILADNDEQTVIYVDELAGMFKNIDRYSSNGFANKLCSLFDHSQTRVDRQTKESLLIEQPCLNLFGTIQPDVFERTMKKGDATDNGLLERFLFVWPQDFGAIKTLQEIPQNITDEWKNTIEQLIQACPATLSFENENVADIYSQYKEVGDNKKRSEYRYKKMAAYRCKLDIHVLRLCIVISCLKGETSVSKETLEYAIDVASYFESTMMRVYDLISSGSTSAQQSHPKDCPREYLFASTYHATQNGDKSKTLQEIGDFFGVTKQSISKAISKFTK